MNKQLGEMPEAKIRNHLGLLNTISCKIGKLLKEKKREDQVLTSFLTTTMGRVPEYRIKIKVSNPINEAQLPDTDRIP
jgi:hypothetical protein